MAEGKLYKLISSPAFSNASDSFKDRVRKLALINPGLFEPPSVPPKIEKTPLETTTTLAQKKGVQGYLEGILDTPAFEKLTKYGIAPDIAKKNVWGKIGAITSFPLKKVMSTLNTIPRAGAAFARGVLEEPIEKMKSGETKDFGTAFKDVFKSIPKGYKEGTKAAFNLPSSKYKDQYWADAYKDWFKDTKFTKGYEWTKDQDDWVKGTNWIQKALSAVAGSPADVAGLATDIVLDPLTYLTGGVAKGFKIADIGTDIVVKGGKTAIPKGSTVVMKKGFKEAFDKALPKLLPKVAKTYGDEIAGITEAVGKKQFANRKAAELFITREAKNWTEGTLGKYLDIGGAKFAGQTYIPGYKLQKTFGKSMEKIGDIKFLRPLNELFNPYYGMPEALRPGKAYADSTMRKIYGEDMTDIMKALDPLKGIGGKTTENFKTVDTLLGATRDINKYTDKATEFIRRLKKATKKKDKIRLKGQVTKNTNKVKRLEKIVKELEVTPKIQKAADEIRESLRKMYGRESAYPDIGYKPLADYYPLVAKGEKLPKKTTLLSAEEAFFQKHQTNDILKLMDKGIETEELTKVLSLRAKAGANRIRRAEELDLVKQFGLKGEVVKTKAKKPKIKAPEGYVQLKDPDGKAIPELKGFYFPKEFEDTFTRVYQAFFGDEAAKNLIQYHDKILTVWKRWALATPGYHARNFYSDTFSGAMEYGMDFFKPKRWQDAFNTVVLKKPIKVNGVTYTYDDLVKAGIPVGTQTATEGGLKMGRPATVLEKVSPAQYSLKAGNYREGLGRTVAGIIELERGGTLIDAAFTVKKVFFDYHSLTAFEQNVMKRFIPFYTWMRKNIQRQAELVFTRTGRYAAIPKTKNYLEQVAETRYGPEFMEEYKRNRPDYYKDLGATITAMTNKEGQPLVLNPNLPFQDWSRLGGRDVLSSMNPVLKFIVEKATNRDLFFDSIIDRAREGQGNYREAPSWLSAIAKTVPNSVLKYVGMEKAEDSKVYITDFADHVMRQIPFLYTAKRLLPAEQTPKTPLDWLSVGGGIKFFNFDLEKEKKKKLQSFIDDINAELNRRRTTGQEIPDLQELKTQFKGQYETSVGEQFGMPNIRKLEDLINILGGNGKMRDYIKQAKQPYKEEMGKATGADLLKLYQLLKERGLVKG